MKILGIESSCDDTGIAVIENGKILENIIISQYHKNGVIPEYAARAHHIAIYEATKKVFNNIDLIAYTNGPGLIGSLFIGSSFAKGLSYSTGVPTVAVNHLEGHILLPYWLYDFEMPFLCLLVSGGHSMLILVRNIGEYSILSKSIDDAVGEVFDKVARHIGLGYPGGPLIEKLAKDAKNKYQYKFPKVMVNRDDFSFSGLKTAAINQISSDASDDEKADFCNQFQSHIAFLLADKFEYIYKKHLVKNWVVSGGVAANEVICAKINEVSLKYGAKVFYPPVKLCTDNGVMIAAAGSYLYEKNGKSSLSIKPFSVSKI